MPTERMEEVEVVWCEKYEEDWEGRSPLCTECGREESDHETPYIAKMTVAPNSLTAARLRLADAAEAREVAHRKRMARIEMGLDCSVDREYLEALAAEEDAEDQEVEAFEALAALRTARGEG